MSLLTDVKKFFRSMDLDVVRGGRRRQLKHLKVVVVGAGVVGGSVAAWIAERYDNLFVYELPAVAERLRRDGLTTYPEGQPERARQVPIQIAARVRS